jgi:hypothetical protein
MWWHVRTMSEIKPNGDERQTNDNLAALLTRMNPNQLAYIAKRVWTVSDVDAARECGISPSTVKAWKVNGAPIDEAVELMRQDGVVLATEMLRRALSDAVEVKVAGLRHRDARIQQDAATEIIDRNLGKPTQRSESKVSTDDKLTALLAKLTGDG